MSKSENLPLSGIVVLDLTQIYNGPYATFLLAMAGATVIKVEPPDGEHLRKRTRSDGVTEPFAVLNGNKQCITLNLRQAAGRRVLLELAKTADVVVENYAPGVMDRLGLGEDVLRSSNPSLVIASGSGYGSKGPYRSYPAMDVTMQAMSGVMSVTGMPDGMPVKAGPAICDFFGGIHLYGAIVTALYQRVVTGKASTVEVSMLSAVFPSLLSNLGLHKAGDRGNKRTGNRHGGLSIAPYNVYPTSDGQIAILANNDEHWRALTQALGRPHWQDDPRFATRGERVRHIDAVDQAIADVTKHHTKTALFDLLIAARVPCAPVRELDDVVNDPHLHETGMLRWIEHPAYGKVLIHGSPLVFKDQELRPYRPSHELGEDSRTVLARHLGMNDASFDELAEEGAFS